MARGITLEEFSMIFCDTASPELEKRCLEELRSPNSNASTWVNEVESWAKEHLVRCRPSPGASHLQSGVGETEAIRVAEDIAVDAEGKKQDVALPVLPPYPEHFLCHIRPS